MGLKLQLVKAIEAKLERAGKRQDVIAQAYGISRTDVSLLRRGKAYATFSTDKAISIAEAFGVGYESSLIDVECKPFIARVAAEPEESIFDSGVFS